MILRQNYNKFKYYCLFVCFVAGICKFYKYYFMHIDGYYLGDGVAERSKAWVASVRLLIRYNKCPKYTNK